MVYVTGLLVLGFWVAFSSNPSVEALFWPKNDGSKFLQCQNKTCPMSEEFMLDCSSSKCTTIPTNLDKKLTILRLKNNFISGIPQEDFKYGSLKELDLSDNNITTIPSNAFSGLSSLEILVLSSNKIRELESSGLVKLNNLKQLFLNGNKLKSLESSLFYYPSHLNLTLLELSHNQLEVIDDNAFTDLTSLENLHLDNNQLKRIKAPFFQGLSGLQRLYLDRNVIEEIEPKSFHQCSSLTYLDLSYNRLISLPADTFDSGLKSLSAIHLEWNSLKVIDPNVFSGTPVLEKIHLDHNLLEDLPKGLPKSMDEISMTNMPKLRRITSGNLDQHKNLKRIIISDNPQLNEIESGAFGGKDSSVTSLDLSDNALTSIPDDLVNWEQVENLDLGDNPWKCDCHMEWVKEVYMTQEAKQKIRCQEPSSLRGRAVSELSYEDFTCPWITLNQTGVIGFCIFGFLLMFGLMSLLVVKSRRRIGKYFRGKKQHSYKPINNKDKESDETKAITVSADTVHFDRYSEERKILREKSQHSVPEMV